MSKLQPIYVCHLVGLILLFTAGSSLAQSFDWLESQGPEGGHVASLVQAPNGDLYAGLLERGGLYRSTDQGSTWQETGLGYLNVHSLVVNNAGAIFAGTSNGTVYRSVDNGATWPDFEPNLVNSTGALAYDPDLDIVYAARGELVSRTLDGGDTWIPVSNTLPFVLVNCMAAVPDGGPIFVGTESDYVYRSDNGGFNWTQFDTGLTHSGVHDFLIVSEGDIYAATWGGGVFRTAWDGASWTQLANGLDDPYCQAVGRDDLGNLWAGTVAMGTYVSVNGGLDWAPSRTGLEIREIRDLLFLGGGELLAGCGGGGVYRTSDSGANWTPSSSGINRCGINSLHLAENGDLFAALQGEGVHRSTDGGASWSPANQGIVDPIVFDVVSDPDGDLFCGTWSTQVYRSTDGGATWTLTGTAPDMEGISSLAVHPGTGEIYAGGFFSGGVWRSADKGGTWLPARGGLPVGGVTDLVVEDTGHLLAAPYGEGVYRSQDNGTSWTALNTGLPSLYVNEVLSLPGGVLFAAVPYFGLQRSQDDGATWETVDSSLNDSRIRSVVVNPSGFLFAGVSASGKVFQSTDGGDSWFSVATGFSHVQIHTLGFNEIGNLLAGSNGFSIFYTDQTTPVFLRDFRAVRSADGAVTVSWNFPADSSPVTSEVFRSVGGSARERISSAVPFGGPDFEFVDLAAPDQPCEYWLRLTDANGTQSWFGPVSVDQAHLTITRLSIEAVWPNPAPGSTTIRYAVPGNQTVSLEVYDLAGRLVRRLRQDTGGPGTLEAVWDARDDRGSRVAAGTYFLRLHTDARVVTAKVVLLGDGR